MTSTSSVAALCAAWHRRGRPAGRLCPSAITTVLVTNGEALTGCVSAFPALSLKLGNAKAD